MKLAVRSGFAAVMFLVLASGPAWAQATAQLSGTVHDESGAVLPGVTVTATQTDTGVSRTAVTDESGAYVLSNLPLGPYRLEVSLQGFRTYVQTGIVLQVGAAPVLNPVLGLGSLEESVTVDAAAPLVDVQSAGISDVVEQEQIVELPLQGRRVTDLIVLAGAAVNTGDVSGQRNRQDAVAISVAGGLRTGVAYVLDGAMHNDPYDNTNMPFPFPDALQEFSVATGGLSAQAGMHSGAAVNAVTRSGTNALHGNAFEFLRHHQFNSSEQFAALGPDGKKVSDGLVRNQFGGTLGGPILRDRLFFFGGVQGTVTRQTPASFVAFVPTAAMLAGDFTAIASPACNAGRQVALRAPFVNNRIDPAQFSRAAVTISQRLPATADPCGEIRYSVPLDNNDKQFVARGDYQLSANHSLFARYIDTFENRLPTLSRTGNILTVRREFGANKQARAVSLALGDTLVLGANVVNAFRVTLNRTKNRLNDPPDKFFDAPELGIKLHTYVPGVIGLAVTNGFTVSGGNSVKVRINSESYQVADDISIVRGRHQMSIGGAVSFWTLDNEDNARAAGDFNFNGQATGIGLADFLTGQTSLVRHGAPGLLLMNQWYLGAFAQDTWRLTDRVTLNAGLRWEPYFGQNLRNGAVSNFSLENFRQGIKTQRFINAPAGLIYPGDAGFPEGNSGIATQWRNMSPRVGGAWDVTGDGRTAIRSSYGINYDFPSSIFMYIAASASPFANRVELSGVPFEDPYRFVGGDTHPLSPNPPPDAQFPPFGAYGVMDPDINSTRVQQWNVTAERQIGQAWQASASYIGSYADRLWGQVHINPGTFMGLGPCTIAGVSYPSCTVTGNVDRRRTLYLENPVLGQGLGPIVKYDDVGEQSYRGLKLSVRRRADSGLSLSGNYTISQCEADTDVSGSFSQFGGGYLDPNNPSFDRGNCTQNRTHIGNVSIGIQTPVFGNQALRVLASDWRFSGIVSARSGSWLTVTTGRDIAGTGILPQRVNQILDDAYPEDRTLDRYLNPAAFAYPAAGTLGDHRNGSIEGPGFWTADLAVSRNISFGAQQGLELRVEVFNLFNNFNWGNPNTNLDAGTFGRITTQTGDPRILQFGMKYGF
jgi:hypothetical protein